MNKTYIERDMEEYTKSWHTNLLTIFIVSILLIINGISFAKRVDFRRLYWIANGVEKYLKTPEKTIGKMGNIDITPIAFGDINTIRDVEKYMKDTISKFLIDLGNTTNGNNPQIKFITMKMRILSTESRTSNCYSTNKCYYSNYLKYPSTLNNILEISNDISDWNNDMGLNPDEKGNYISGYFSKYDGTGEVMIMGLSGLITIEAIRTMRQAISTAFMSINSSNIEIPSIRAFIITFSYNNIPMDVFVTVNIVFYY